MTYRIPRPKRIAIQQFVAAHEDCRAIIGERWRALTVYVLGNDYSTSKRILIARPRTDEAAREVFDHVNRFVRGLELQKRVSP